MMIAKLGKLTKNNYILKDENFKVLLQKKR